MIISHTYKFAIVTPPKTASTTLHEWLIAPPFCDHHYPPPSKRKEQHDTPDGLDDHYTVAVAWRDPRDREVSLWAHSQSATSRKHDRTPKLTFAEFVLDYQPEAIPFYSASQAWWISRLPRVDYVIRQDNLQADTTNFPPIHKAITAGHMLRAMPRLNTTRHRPWREHYTPELERIVQERFADDLLSKFARPTR